MKIEGGLSLYSKAIIFEGCYFSRGEIFTAEGDYYNRKRSMTIKTGLLVYGVEDYDNKEELLLY